MCRASQKTKVTQNLKRALLAQRMRLVKLFDLWDEDGNGSLSEQELRHAVRMLGVKVSDSDFRHFCKEFDKDRSGDINLKELMIMLNAQPAEEHAKMNVKKNIVVRFFGSIYWLLNTTAVQTVLYFAFVAVFQLLVDTMRLKVPASCVRRPHARVGWPRQRHAYAHGTVAHGCLCLRAPALLSAWCALHGTPLPAPANAPQEEYFVQKVFADTILHNDFDEQHNEFEQIRRPADIWEWGNTVLWPGLLGNSGA